MEYWQLNLKAFQILEMIPAPRFCPINGTITEQRAITTINAKASTLIPVPTAATASGPKLAVIPVKIAMARGLKLCAMEAGSAMVNIRFQLFLSICQFGERRARSFFLWLRTYKDRTKLKNLLITVAMDAPSIPIAGIPANPKIIIGSRIQFIMAENIMINPGVVVSPVARIAEFPTIGTTRKIIPLYQGTI
jgi:hypothetical protein